MNTFEHIKASVTEENIVQLDIKVNVAELNKESYIGNFNNISNALFEAMINQYNNGDKEGARNTLTEIKKLAFWDMIGVTQGSIEIENGVLYGLKERVEIDESLKTKINEGVKSNG